MNKSMLEQTVKFYMSYLRTMKKKDDNDNNFECKRIVSHKIDVNNNKNKTLFQR